MLPKGKKIHRMGGWGQSWDVASHPGFSDARAPVWLEADWKVGMPKAFIHAERGGGCGLGRQTRGSPVASAAGRSVAGRGHFRALVVAFWGVIWRRWV